MVNPKHKILFNKIKEMHIESEKNLSYILSTAKNDKHYDNLSDEYGRASSLIELFLEQLFPTRYFYHAESDSYIKEFDPSQIEELEIDGVDEIDEEKYKKYIKNLF